MLMEVSASGNSRDTEGWTALHEAACIPQDGSGLLLGFGAEVDARTGARRWTISGLSFEQVFGFCTILRLAASSSNFKSFMLLVGHGESCIDRGQWFNSHS